MTELLPLLEPRQALKLQQLNKFFYQTGISRVQSTLKKLKKLHYLTYGHARDSKNSLFVYNNIDKTVLVHQDKRFNFDFHRGVQFLDSLVAISFQTMQVRQFKDPTDQDRMRVIELS